MRGLLVSLLVFLAWTAAAEEVSLTARPVPLGPGEEAGARLGGLTYLGGLEIESGDPDFGGWSGGTASPDLGRLLLVSDRGRWTAMTLLRDGESGRPLSVEAGVVESLLDLEGQPLSTGFRWDAEALAALGEGRVAVGFEHDHRIWLYGEGLGGRASESIGPDALATLPLSALNQGVEALALSPDGAFLVAILEGPGPEGTTSAFFRREGKWHRRDYRAEAGFGVTDAAFLPGGDLLTLERFYSPETGPIVHLRQVAARDLAGEGVLTGRTIASLRRPRSVDNFELLLVGQDADGSPLVLIGSDDNFNPNQRFLLLLFRLEAGP